MATTINYIGFTLSGSAITGWPVGQTRYYQYGIGVSCDSATSTFLALTDAQKVNLTTTNPPPVPAGNAPWTVRDCAATAAATVAPLLAAAGRSPVLQKASYRVREASGRKGDIQLAPATGWRYKAQNTTGAYTSQVPGDWSALAWTDVPDSGLFTINGPASGDNFSLVRIGSKTTDETFDLSIRMQDLVDWTVAGGGQANTSARSGFAVLEKTDTTRFNVVLDHYDTDGWAVVRDTSGFARDANTNWYWSIENSPFVVGDNQPFGLVKLPPDSYVAIHRTVTLAAMQRLTGGRLELTQSPFSPAFIQADYAFIYTGKP